MDTNYTLNDNPNIVYTIRDSILRCHSHFLSTLQAVEGFNHDFKAPFTSTTRYQGFQAMKYDLECLRMNVQILEQAIEMEESRKK